MTTTIWALGGHSHAAPRDTLPACWGALGAGADGLVITVSATRDSAVVCAPSQVVREGAEVRVADMTLEELQQVDAGAAFRSGRLDADHRIIEAGADTPWAGKSGRPNMLTHPTLDRVLLHFSRRSRLLLLLNAAEGAERELAARVDTMLRRFGVRDRVMVGGNRVSVAPFIGETALCILHDREESPDSAAAHAAALGARLMADATVLLDADVAGVPLIVRADPGYAAVRPDQFGLLRKRAQVEGWAAPAVDLMHELVHPRGVILEEAFEGPSLDATLWASGYSRRSEDTTLEVDGGIRIQMQGDDYSGGAVFSEFAVCGAFDARIAFEVDNPGQGTTLELAVVQIDAGYHRPNLTFDVHGAPPYASSERDEADGFRIGWNNGPALTRWVGNEPQSSNLYNNYSRDVGYGGADSPAGELRLTRCGEVFSAYYRDSRNSDWVLSGAALVPALAQSVFFRIAAKHWPKAGAQAPTNEVRFRDFQLRQW